MKQRFGVAAHFKYENKEKKSVNPTEWSDEREERREKSTVENSVSCILLLFLFFVRPIVNLRDKLDLFCAIKRTASFKWLLFHRILYYTFVCLALAKATQSHWPSLCNGNWDCCGCLCIRIERETSPKIAKHILSLRLQWPSTVRCIKLYVYMYRKQKETHAPHRIAVPKYGMNRTTIKCSQSVAYGRIHCQLVVNERRRRRRRHTAQTAANSHRAKLINPMNHSNAV